MKLSFITVCVIVSTILSKTQCQESNPVEITINRNGINLKGKLYISEGIGTFPTVILLHGFSGNNQDVLGMGSKLSDAGIVTLTFNYSGTHQSEGEISFENTQKDIEAAFEFIYLPENVQKYKIDTACIYLGGYSYGGGHALTFAANHPEIKSVFSIAGNDHGEFFREYNSDPDMREMIDRMFDELKASATLIRFDNYFNT